MTYNSFEDWANNAPDDEIVDTLNSWAADEYLSSAEAHETEIALI